MQTIRDVVFLVVATAVLLFFGAGVWLAAYYTLWVVDAPRPEAMPEIVSYFVSAVNGTLAANLGAILGISTLRRAGVPMNKTEIFQWIAACWYILALLGATWCWGLTGFSSDEQKVVAVLPELTKNGIGIFIAVLAAVLGVQTVRTAGGTPTPTPS